MHRWSLTLGTLVLGSMMFLSACGVSPFGPDDKAVVSDIQAKLFQDSALKTRDIHVTAHKGMVILTGTVNTDLEKSEVERLARQARGVNQVENQVSVASAPIALATPRVIEQAPPAQPAISAPERPTPRGTERAAAKRERRATETRNASSRRDASEPAPPPTQNRSANDPEVISAPPLSPPPPPPPIRVTIPAGTVVSVRLVDSVDSSRDHAGQEFGASLASPIVVGERVVAGRGESARVRLVAARNSGRMTGQSEVQLELSSVTVAGTTYETRSTAFDQRGASRGRRTAATVGGGAALGAIIGGIAGHGKGAAIGSVIGAGAGTAVEAGTKPESVRVPSETKLDFTLQAPITVTLPPDGAGTRN